MYCMTRNRAVVQVRRISFGGAIAPAMAVAFCLTHVTVVAKTDELIPARKEDRKSAYERMLMDRTTSIESLILLLQQVDANRGKFGGTGFSRCVDELQRKIDAARTPHEKTLLEQELSRLWLTLDDEDRSEGGREFYAIRLLGQLRAPEAVQPLLDRIDARFSRAGSPLNVVEPIVIQALVSIGKPASLATLERIAMEESKDRSERYLQVIVLVEGRELAREMVRLKASKEENVERKARLMSAAESLTPIAGRQSDDPARAEQNRPSPLVVPSTPPPSVSAPNQ
ncbi:MAG: hypothetical protein K2R98_08195 [Gemmataceae bacterium]|nr:hypothetical protein [Gemmataceae bacterium]